MGYLDTSDKRKSAIITGTIMAVLLLFFTFVSVLTELEEPEESGIAINFGNTVVGSGPVEPAVTTRVSPPSNPEPQTQTTQQTDNVATQENTDAPVINSDPTNDRPVEKPVDKPIKKPVEKKPDPKPDQNVLDALNSVTGADPVDGDTDTGEGPGDGPGNKGDINGDPYANTYYGDPGTGQGGKGFGLKGRSRLGYKKVLQTCDETGTVVVEITVNKLGKVVKAVPGKRGTTNRIQCLLDAARETAESYKFSPARDARNDFQIGFVEVIFKLGE